MLKAGENKADQLGSLGLDLPGFLFGLLYPRLRAEEVSNQEVPMDTCLNAPHESLVSLVTVQKKSNPARQKTCGPQLLYCSQTAQKTLWLHPHPHRQRPSRSLDSHPPPAVKGCSQPPTPGWCQRRPIGSCGFHPCRLVRRPPTTPVGSMETT